MGTEVFHTEDTDQYVVWSSVSDSPHAWGSYDEILEYLVKTDREKDEYSRPVAIQRLERAKAKGTSALYYLLDRENGTIQYGQEGYFLYRDLSKFLAPWDATKDFDLSLLTPFED